LHDIDAEGNNATTNVIDSSRKCSKSVNTTGSSSRRTAKFDDQFCLPFHLFRVVDTSVVSLASTRLYDRGVDVVISDIETTGSLIRIDVILRHTRYSETGRVSVRETTRQNILQARTEEYKDDERNIMRCPEKVEEVLWNVVSTNCFSEI
jgi:hypothetical protein